MKNIKFSLLIALVAWLSGCYKESDYNQPLQDDLFKITSDKDSIPADGFSTVKIIVEIPLEANDSSSKIIFKTTAGTFVEGGLKTLTLTAKKNVANNTKIGEAILRSSINVETAIVSVELFNLKKNIEIKFINSYPEKLKISSSSLSIKPLNNSMGEVNIDGIITKAQGAPSAGNIIDVAAYDSLFAKKVGSFRVYNNQSNESGKTSYVFVLGDSVSNNIPTAYIGNLYLIAKSSKNSQNQFLTDTVKLISSR